jgi:predicted P-loop ATPase
MLIDKLGGQWFSDSVVTVQGKEAYEALQGVWLIELAELAQLKKAEVEMIKHFISKREDRYRVAYGRRTENFPRQCVFFGTSNNKDFLRDATGNRRFWPVSTYAQEPYKDIGEGLTQHEVNQIWAEAIELYRKGEKLYLTPELEAAAMEAQREHSEVDERAGLIQAYLEKKLPENWDEMDIGQRRSYLNDSAEAGIMAAAVNVRKRVCVAEIWEECLGGRKQDMTTHNTKFIHDIMRQMDGWAEAKTKIRFSHYGIQRGYIRLSK